MEVKHFLLRTGERVFELTLSQREMEKLLCSVKEALELIPLPPSVDTIDETHTILNNFVRLVENW